MSLRARLLAAAVRRVIRPEMRGTLDIPAIRRAMERRALNAPPGIVCERMTLGGVASERLLPSTATGRERPLLYLHGGGFVCCSPRTHRAITGAFAKRGFDVFVPDYRLAPEHRFPAAIEDVVAAWRAVSGRGPAVIAGDSAGANLALAAMLRARAEGLALPRAAALFSPPVDLVGTAPSLRANADRDPMFEVEGLRQFAEHYLGDADAADPLVSPLYADLTGLPPLVIHVGATEVLLDDSLRLAERARAASVEVDLTVFDHVPHVWQWADRFLPEARASLDRAARVLRRHC